MLLPIGDEPNPRGVPVVTWALMAINIAVFLLISLPLMSQAPDTKDPETLAYLHLLQRHEPRASLRFLLSQLTAYDVFVFQHGFRPVAPSFADLFTSMFLHAGWMHLLGNMLFLWIFGDNVEFHLGRGRYLVVYLLTGVCATVCFAIFQLDSGTPLVGASGAISGVLGCYFIWFPRNRVRVLMVLILFINVINVPARLVLGFYILAENLLPLLLSSGSSVAYGAHIGGFFGGLGTAVLLDRWSQARPLSGTATSAKEMPWQSSEPTPMAAPAHDDSVGGRFRAAISAHRFDIALREYSLMDLGSRRALDPEEVLALADWLTENDRYETALAVLQRLMATNPRSPQLSRIHLRAGLIQLRGLGRPTAAYQHLLAVLDLDPPHEVAEAARAGLQEIETLRQRRRFH